MTKDAWDNRSVYDIENHQTEYYYSTNTGSTPDAKYYYDGDGKRIKKVVGTETTIFIYNARGNLAAEYTLGVTANPSPQTNYITIDTLGSTRLVTNGAGQVVARHDYLPFGDESYGLGGRTSAQGFAQPDTTRRRFTGYEHDTETGLDFAKARYYGNGLGRFTGVDPLLASAKSETPQTWNRYIYVVNNPLKYVDPTGMDGTPWDLLSQEEQMAIAGKLGLDPKLSGDALLSAAATAFNKMAASATEYSVKTFFKDGGINSTITDLLKRAVATSFAYGVKMLIQNTGGLQNSAVWKQITRLQGGWIGPHFDASLSLNIGDPAAFREALKTDGRYDVNQPYEYWAAFRGEKHNDSARFITWDSHSVGMHIVQDPGQPLGTWFVHWDRRSAAFINVDPKYSDRKIPPLVGVTIQTAREQEQIKAGLEHGNGISAYDAYISLRDRQRLIH